MMFVVTKWDIGGTIEYVDPKTLIEGGDEALYMRARPDTLPSDENEFLMFEAAKMELIARLRQRADELMNTADSLVDLTEQDVRRKHDEYQQSLREHRPTTSVAADNEWEDRP